MMLDNVVIRQFQSSDLKEVQTLFLDAFQSYKEPETLRVAQIHWSKTKVKEDISDVQGRYLDVKGGNFWVAEEHQSMRIVGFAGVRPAAFDMFDFNKENDAESFEIAWMGVHDDYRGKGLALLLLQHLEKFVNKENFGKKVFFYTLTETIPACKFYKKNGYKEIGDAKEFPLRHGFPEANMDGAVHVQRFEKVL